jgi:hypothetical protein
MVSLTSLSTKFLVLHKRLEHFITGKILRGIVQEWSKFEKLTKSPFNKTGT